jgi:hypothetical protein
MQPVSCDEELLYTCGDYHRLAVAEHEPVPSANTRLVNSVGMAYAPTLAEA